MSSQQNDIYIKNAKVHNLKGLSVGIKRNKLTVVTGVSGSGKSSLVFDTLYAEGQRRYVESLSSYARQFLGRMNKPEVDYIKGISPAIAIEQKVNIRNPRSTVATSTELYDYLKLLFARVGKTFSPVSKKLVKMHTVTDVVNTIINLPTESKVLLLVKILPNEERNIHEELKILLQKGFSKMIFNQENIKIEDFLEQNTDKPTKKKQKDEIYLLIDRFVVEDFDEDALNRLSDSVLTAFTEGKGECFLNILGETNTLSYFSNKFEMDDMKFEIPSVNFFAFNNPFGACKTCEGYGSVIGISDDLVIPNHTLSVYEEAVMPWRGEKMSEWKNHFIKLSRKNDFPIHRPYNELNLEQKDFLWHGGDNWEGIDGFFKEIEAQTFKIQYRVMLSRFRGRKTCPDCLGTRLRKDTAYVLLVDEKINTDKSIKNLNPFNHFKNLQQVVLLNISSALSYFNSITLSEHDKKISDRIIKEIVTRLQCLEDVGLGYLSLNRLSNTLSGGESQRINLATSLGSSLVGSLYILDEPSIGLHSRDTQRLIKVLKNLRNLGNTVIVVEHDEEIMEIADEIIDIGPLAGTEGGQLTAQGTIEEIKINPLSLTGKYLSGIEEIAIPAKRRKFTNTINIKGACQNNLKSIDVEFPLNVINVVTGVSGSGKTTLVKSVLYPSLMRELGLIYNDKIGKLDSIDGAIKNITQVEMIDQNPIGKSSRSNPVTYIKAYDAIRDLFASQTIAKSRGYKPSHFSFNVEGGRCETCQGEGETIIEMQFMADIKLPCEDCGGARFKSDILEVTYNNKNISEVLQMTIDDAVEYFASNQLIVNKLTPLLDVGLGYIQMGQSASTLSGGEAQRVKLATFLGKGLNTGKILFIFDEPTTGLHFHDIKKLIKSFNALIDNGHSVIIIEHNLEIIKCADWVIDLGPEGGDLGGNVLFAGTPEELIKVEKSYTAKYLAHKLKQTNINQ